MTFSSVIRYLKDGEAAKTPAMRGYVKRNDNTPAEGETANYDITFVESSDADSDGVSEYRFNFVEADGNVSVSAPGFDGRASEAPFKVDGVLLQLLLGDKWEVASAEDAEVVRTGSGQRW